MGLIPLLGLWDRFQILAIFARRPQFSNVIPHVVFKKLRNGMAAILNGVAWFYALSIGYVPKSLLAPPHTSDFSLDRLADRFGNPDIHIWQPLVPWRRAARCCEQLRLRGLLQCRITLACRPSGVFLVL